MSLHTWLVINAFLGLLFGTMLVLMPRNLIKRSTNKVDEVALIFARSLGGATLGIAWINWVSRSYTGSSIVWAVVWANIILHIVNGLADLKATTDKTYNQNGWGSVVLHFVLAIIFAYYLIFSR